MPDDLRIKPSEISSKTFPITRKGFEQQAVKSFLDEIATEFIRINEELIRLRSEIKELQSREIALDDISEDKLYETLGRHAAKILEQAKHAADQTIKEAQDKAAQILNQAESLLAQRAQEADNFAQEIISSAKAEAEKIKLDANQEHQQIINAAKESSQQLLNEAQQARKVILTDLAKRRKHLRSQVEQLIAGKNALLKTISQAKEILEKLENSIQDSSNAAKAAAEAASTKVSLENDPSLDQLVELASEIHPLADQEKLEAQELDESTNQSDLYEGVRILGAVPAKTLAHDEKSDKQTTDPDSANNDLKTIEEIFSKLKHSQQDSEIGNQELKKPDNTESEKPNVVVKASKSAENAEDNYSFALATSQKLALVVAELSRKIKRVLSDEQNDLLNNLRTSKQGQDLDSLVTECFQKSQLTNAIFDSLIQLLNFNDNFVNIDKNEINLMSSNLSQDLLNEIQEKLSKEKIVVNDSNKASLQEKISATYREIRSQKVDDLVGDYVYKTYNLLTFKTAKENDLLFWVPTTTPCSDCEDNSLAKEITSSETFPTGSSYPPAHRGCRCILLTHS